MKNPTGKFALFQGNIKSASEWEAPGSELPLVKEEAKAVKEVGPLAHHCRSLLTQAHCSLPTDACSVSCSSHHAQVSSQCMLSSHVCPSFSHCYLPLPAGEEKGIKAAAVKEDVKAEAKEEVKKEAPKNTSKAEGKKAVAAAIVVPLPLDGDGNPMDTEKCTVTMIEEGSTKKRHRTKRG